MTAETVLVLAGYDLKVIPVVRWLSDRFRVVLIATKNATNQRHHAAFSESIGLVDEWRWIDDAFDDYGTVEQALRWHQSTPISHVVCLDEFGLMFAAELREQLGVVSGQSVASATAFRLKSQMYDLVRDSVAVPEYVTARTTFEVKRAVERIGLPTVIKPVDGGGSQDTFALRTEDDLHQWLAARPIALTRPVLVQRFVDAPMYHVDGVAAAGEVHSPVVSRYGTSTLGYHDDQPLTSAMIDEGSQLHRTLVDEVKRVLAALPDSGGCSFHAEFFVSEDGEVHFCEIASRTGGAGVASCYQLATGMDLFQAHSLLQCGIVDEVIERLRDSEARTKRYGWYLQTASAGTLLSVAERCELSGVVDYDVSGRIGQRRAGPMSSVDAIQKFIIEFLDDTDAEKLFHGISQWCAVHNIVVPSS